MNGDCGRTTTGIKAEIHGMDWDDALRRMRAGEFDVIDLIFKTQERTDYWSFSKPYARINVPIFFQKDISGITGLESLKGFPVAAKAETPRSAFSSKTGSPRCCFSPITRPSSRPPNNTR